MRNKVSRRNVMCDDLSASQCETKLKRFFNDANDTSELLIVSYCGPAAVTEVGSYVLILACPTIKSSEYGKTQRPG